jgi:hypothetical protein
MLSVDDEQFKIAFQEVEDRFPVHASHNVANCGRHPLKMKETTSG